MACSGKKEKKKIRSCNGPNLRSVIHELDIPIVKGISFITPCYGKIQMLSLCLCKCHIFLLHVTSLDIIISR